MLLTLLNAILIFFPYHSKVIHRPSIGRYTKLEEPKARESLLTPGMRHSSSKSSLKTSESTGSGPTITAPQSNLSIEVNLPTPVNSATTSEFSALPMVKAANAALMERTPFAIDDATGDDDDSDLESEREGDDDQVMDEVCTLDSFITEPPPD